MHDNDEASCYYHEVKTVIEGTRLLTRETERLVAILSLDGPNKYRYNLRDGYERYRW